MKYRSQEHVGHQVPQLALNVEMQTTKEIPAMKNENPMNSKMERTEFLEVCMKILKISIVQENISLQQSAKNTN